MSLSLALAWQNWRETKAHQRDVYLPPRSLGVKGARPHLPALGAVLAVPTKEQADYIGVGVNGPFKGDTYRY